jgi:adenosylcobyric acid synthase
VLGLHVHELFESPAVVHALFGAQVQTPDSLFDCRADFIDACFEPGVLLRLLRP